jgi:hypothetical protein
MSCWTIPAAAATHVARSARFVVHHTAHASRRFVGHFVRRVYHPVRHYVSAHIPLPHPAVITRIVCKPGPGFLTALAKTVGPAVLGGALLAAPTPLANALRPASGLAAPDVGGPAPATGALGTSPASSIPGLSTGTPVQPVSFQNVPTPPQVTTPTTPTTPIITPPLITPPLITPPLGTPPVTSPPITNDIPPAVPVPEPASFVVLGAGLTTLAMVRRRRLTRRFT